MGMEQTVSYAGSAIPTWPVVRDFLQQRGFSVQVRMVDGELAFPDEIPAESWRELRVATPGGMITLRRDKDRVIFVTWGNAEVPLRQGWNALAWAFAVMGDGKIHSEAKVLTAEEFSQQRDLPPELS